MTLVFSESYDAFVVLLAKRRIYILPIQYKGISVLADLRLDFFIEKNIVAELKSVSEILPIHQAQLMTYMKLMKAPKGILLNFNVVNLYHEGQKTFVNNYFSNLDRGQDCLTTKS
nr:GxxExxY protein [Algoriphagus sp. AGSA1]